MLKGNLWLSDVSSIKWGDRVWEANGLLFRPIIEVFYGIRTKTIPLGFCLWVGAVLCSLVLFHVDTFVASKVVILKALYPHRPKLYWAYCIVMASTGFWFWGLVRAYQRQRLVKTLTEAFLSSGLKNALGKFPSFIFDVPVDKFTRKLRLKRNNLTKEQFQKAQPSLESGLQVFIDEFRENRENGTLDVMYSHFPMPTVTYFDDIMRIPPSTFVVGKTRAQQITVNFDDVPHLLIAGQTGSGKSTQLRGLITTLYVNNSDYDFTLIDLKGGLEFQTFERLSRISVVESVAKAIPVLKKLQGVLENRMAAFKIGGCKDIQAFHKLPPEKKDKVLAAIKGGRVNRHILVVDEIAEMFLSGGPATNQQIQTARRILSQIARQGRSIGVHIVAATQRPDAKAIDSQVKANLTGVLCFRMLNDASSITVLGNGRASDLPQIAGRAIWKCGADMFEVQTPYLSADEAEKILGSLRQEPVEIPEVQEPPEDLDSAGDEPSSEEEQYE